MTFAAAHRGLSAEVAENTTAAFQAAIDAGFRCLEMDLRLTHDREVVVLHDAGIDRTTDGNGRIKDFTVADLRDYDTGYGPIPKLNDVMTALANEEIWWNLEVKAKGAVEPTIELVEAHGLESRALVSSMDPKKLRQAKDRHPDVPRGLIILGPPDAEDLKEAEKAGCTWVNIDHDFAEPSVLDAIRDHGLRIGAWTVNDVDEALDLASHGVDCIITDQRDVLEALPGKAPKW